MGNFFNGRVYDKTGKTVLSLDYALENRLLDLPAGRQEEPNNKTRIRSGSGASAEYRSSLKTEVEIKVDNKDKIKN